MVERRGLELQRRVVVELGLGRVVQDHAEERLEVGRLVVRLVHRPAVAARAVDDREVELVVVRAELDEQVEDLVQHLAGARVGPVDLVDHHQRLEAVLEGLLEHEARLRHRALGGVDQQQHRVGHAQRALDLAAEVGVAGRVDDVDARAVVVDGRVLGEDRDPALALLRVGVHRALLHVLVGAERAGELEHRVHQRRLAVVDVGHDGDVADGLLVLHGRARAAIGGEQDTGPPSGPQWPRAFPGRACGPYFCACRPTTTSSPSFARSLVRPVAGSAS